MIDLVIASTPRTGGNWLLRLLHENGLPMGGEWLHPGNVSAAKDAYKLSRKTGEMYIVKVHTNELWEYGIELESVTDGTRPVKYLHLLRKNVIQQAESWLGARQTGNWFNGSTRGIVKPDEMHVNALIEMDQWWEDNLPDHEHVVYEDLLEDSEREVNRIKSWLGYTS